MGGGVMQVQSLPLWRQLQAAIDAVEKVALGRSGNEAIAALPVEVRPAAQSLAFHVWRNLGMARSLAQMLAKKAPAPWPHAALHTGLALLQSDGVPRYDEFTLVDQLVEAVKKRSSYKHQAPFINACLRRYLRERAVMDAKSRTAPEAKWNFPAWWIKRLRQDHPKSWEQILTACNTPAPLTLRVNRKQSTQAQYLTALSDRGIAAWSQGAHAITLEKALPVQQLPGFASGMASVQDAGAQRAAELILQGFVHTRETRILDACAAPGGKTGHLVEMSDAKVLAVELDPKRASRINENLQRLQLHAMVKTASVLDLDAWWDGETFDLIVLDAPCTASGIVRRHPDVRWLRREADIKALSAIQREMLQKLWPLVRPGGRLLYCTCSVFAAEGMDQQCAFLASNTDAHILPSPGHMLPTNAAQTALVAHNGATDHDGFFYALFEKSLT
jgi:16S rRNA (cytosine967-C5)-methyltransferase